MLRKNTRTVIVVVIVASLVALNVYTIETLSPRSPSPIPGYPSLSLAYANGYTMLLIRGALGPYIYTNITVTGNYTQSDGTLSQINNTAFNTIYMSMSLPTTSLSFKSRALDVTNHQIYYFNASVTVNLSQPTKDNVFNYPGGQTNYITLGVIPLEVAMEGYSYA